MSGLTCADCCSCGRIICLPGLPLSGNCIRRMLSRTLSYNGWLIRRSLCRWGRVWRWGWTVWASLRWVRGTKSSWFYFIGRRVKLFLVFPFSRLVWYYSLMLYLFASELYFEYAFADGQFAQFLYFLEIMLGCIFGQSLQILQDGIVLVWILVLHEILLVYVVQLQRYVF